MNTDKIYAEQLANEYAPKDTSKVVALRKPDNKAKLPATIFTYTFGIITALVAGEGICLSMKVIGSGATAMFVLGVIAGIIGLLGMGVNYPICKKLLAQGKQKYAYEIMELAKEVSEQYAVGRARKLLQKLLHLLLRDTTSKTLLFAEALASIRGLQSTFSMWCSASWLPSAMPRYGFSPWRSTMSPAPLIYST